MQSTAGCLRDRDEHNKKAAVMNSSALVRKPEFLNAASARIAIIYYAQGSGGTAYERHLLGHFKDALPIEEHGIRSPPDWPRWLRTPTALFDLHRSMYERLSQAMI